MSWTFQLESINRSFERIAFWYKDFMHRTEQCFRELHERITYLEERQITQGPTDEQVERVLRKILAERFSSPGGRLTERSYSDRDSGYFVENPKGLAYPQSVPFDPASLVVEPDSVPSKAYAATFQMLEHQLAHFPHLNQGGANQHGVYGVKTDVEIKKPRSSDSD